MPQGTPTGIEGGVKPSSIEVDGYEPSIFAHRTIDIKGSVVVGTLAVTSCAMTFNVAYGSAPSCLAQDDTNILGTAVTTSTTKMTVTSTTSMSGDTISYHCIQ